MSRPAKKQLRVEVMEKFLDFTQKAGEPEPAPYKPREWWLWCREMDAAGKVLRTFIHEIKALNLANARRQLTAFMKDKTSTLEEW